MQSSRRKGEGRAHPDSCGRLWTIVAIGGIIVLALTLIVHFRSQAPGPFGNKGYDDVVASDSPVAYWPMTDPFRGSEKDLVSGLEGTYVNSPQATRMPNGDVAVAFDGIDQYFEVPDSPRLSPTSSGTMTIEAWIRPDTLQFDNAEGGDYVHWLGKGETGAHEYATRMYNRINDVDRPSRISGYVFNAEGGLGAGSAFEDELIPGEWIHFAFVINPKNASEKYPDGYTKIYRDGVLRSVVNIDIHGESIKSSRTSAPLRVGTRDMGSYFEGAVGKVAIYGYEVEQEDLCDHFAVMEGNPKPVCLQRGTDLSNG